MSSFADGKVLALFSFLDLATSRENVEGRAVES